MRNIKWGLLILIAATGSSYTFAQEPVFSFTTAKNKLYKTVYPNSGDTFYCGCDWSNRKVDLQSCGLQSLFPKGQLKRASRTEAEHIIPASWLLRVNKKDRQCVLNAKASGKSPRAYCQKYDIDYKQAHNDLVNLVPAVGQINAHRSNKPFVDAANKNSKGYNSYGRCNIEIGSRGMVPPNDKKGDIARIAKYMSDKYNVVYSKRQQSLFNEWDKLDPISKDEIERNKRIIKAQGYGQ